MRALDVRRRNFGLFFSPRPARLAVAALLASALALGACGDDDDDPADEDAVADAMGDTMSDSMVDSMGDTMSDSMSDSMSDGMTSDTAHDAGGLAPIPDTAMGPMVDQTKGYLVEEITTGAYWITEGSYQSLFFTTGEGVILVDAPPTIGANLLTAIAEVTSEEVTHFVYSHSHGDHVGAAGAMPAGTTYIGHELTAGILTRAADTNRPVPTVTFADSYTLTVGTQTLELVYPGPNHEPGNIIIWADQQDILMMVDVVYPGWVPFKNLGLAKHIPGFVAAHDAILSYDFTTFVGGHVTRLGTKADVELAREYVHNVQANAAAALASVDFMAVAGKVGFSNPWALFNAYFHEVASYCADLTVPAWLGRLGGVDVFTWDHCLVMMESLRVDGAADGVDVGAALSGSPTFDHTHPTYEAPPAAAAGPTVDQSKGYLVEEIGTDTGVYWVTEGAYQAMFLTTGEGVIIVDAPPTIGANLLAAVAEVTSEAITHVIYSHHHIDHVGSTGLYPDTATYIAHEDAAELLTLANDPNRPVPTVTFADTYTLTVGTQTVELSYPGPNHSPGNLIAYIPAHKVLMVVDVVFPGWVPFKNLALAQDIPGFIALHDHLLTFDFTTFVGGHLTRLGTKDDVTTQRQYVNDIATAAGAALASVDFMAIAGEVGFTNQWALFDAYFDAVADACAADADVAGWVGVLGAADVFNWDHCFVMMESLRID